MSTIHAYASPARGHIYPLAPILAELSRRGHRVRIQTMSSEAEWLGEQELEPLPIAPEIEDLPLEDWKAKNPMQAVQLAFGRWLERAPHEIDDLESAIASDRPDLIVTDINCWGAPAAAEASGIPWASFSPYFTVLPDPAVPPFGPGMGLMGGPLGRLRNRAVGKLLQAGLDRKFLGPLNEIREGAGATPLSSITELWTRPPKLLYMTVRELEYPRQSWPGSFEFVGPVQGEPPAQAPAWLDEIADPLVLVTASTEYQADEDLIATALAALADEPVRVLATSGATDPARYDVPDNARVERFVPHGPVLERAAAVICHGGMGITQKALAAGVPVCTIGWGRDQLESGRRVEHAGAGVLLPRKKLSETSLRDAFRRTRSMRAGAERIATAFERAPGAVGAADLLERQIAVPA